MIPDMTYNVFGGTLSLNQSINHVRLFPALGVTPFTLPTSATTVRMKFVAY